MASFYKCPEKYVTNYRNDLDKVYSAVMKDDSSEVVFAALDMMKKTRTMPIVRRTHKREELSIICRLKGNDFFKNKEYSNALKIYNLAIGSAPKNSEYMALAYSNRSALMQKIKAYGAALKDIETCLSMKCPHIEKKLRLRREECLRMVSEENSLKDNLKHNLVAGLFDSSDARHPEIPCVSTSVGIVKNESRKIVAAKDIPVGSLIGIETAFAGNLDKENSYIACNYCHKLSFNLMPCDTCCEVFFCSNECKRSAYSEYHNIECQIIDMIKEVANEDMYRIAIKAALKIKNMSKSWEELISATSRGLNKALGKSINEIYDANNIHSVLNTCNDYQNFVFGQKFQYSYMVAILIHYLSNIPGFFPNSLALKRKAMQAFSQIIMHLSTLHGKLIMIQNASMIYPKMEVSCEPEASSGLFSFTGKLKHACEPNMLVLGFGNKVALVALRSIPRGEELTISYVSHFYDQDYLNMRPAKLINIKPACQCRVCEENWTEESVIDIAGKMTSREKQFFNDWCMLRLVSAGDPCANGKVLTETKRGLDLLKEKPNAKQYLSLYREFRNQLCIAQYLFADNVYIGT